MGEVTNKVWLRQEGETEKAFTGFQLYLELGADRSVLKAYRLYTGRIEAQQSNGTFSTWATQNNWVARALAYDQWCGSIDNDRYEQSAAKEQSKLAKRRAAANDTAWEMAKLLIEKAKMILKVPILQQTIESEETDDKGNVVKVVKIIMPAKFKVADAALMVKVADNLARLATDMSTSNVSFDLNAQLKRVAEETGVPIHVLTEEYRQMTGKHPPKLLAVGSKDAM